MSNRRKNYYFVWLLILMIMGGVACDKKDTPKDKDVSEVIGTPVITTTPTEKSEITSEVTVTPTKNPETTAMPTPEQMEQKNYLAEKIEYEMCDGKRSEENSTKYGYDSNGTPIYEYTNGGWCKYDARTGALVEIGRGHEHGSGNRWTCEYQYDSQGEVIYRKETEEKPEATVLTKVREWEYDRSVSYLPSIMGTHDCEEFVHKYTETRDGIIVVEVITEYVDGQPVEQVERNINGTELVVVNGITYSERTEGGFRVQVATDWYIDESGKKVNSLVYENWYKEDVLRERRIGYLREEVWEVYTYNEVGQPLESYYRMEAGSKITTYRYTYDEQGRVLTSYQAGDESALEAEYFYHGEGVLVVKKINGYHVTIEVYDEGNLLYEVEVGDSPISIEEVESFAIETEKRIERGIKGFDADGELVFCYSMKSDENGMLVSETAYGEECGVLQSTIYSYGERGQLLSSITVVHQIVEMSDVVAYDNCYTYVMYSYNSNGDLVEKSESSYCDDGTSYGTKTVYKYAPLEELTAEDN